MKLTDAILLGSVFTSAKPRHIDHCALGMAGNAVGIPSTNQLSGKARRLFLILDQWPWLRDCRYESFTVQDAEFRIGVETYGSWIASTFNERVAREFNSSPMTIESLVEQIRAVEPECGECNQFNCSCDHNAFKSSKNRAQFVA